MRITKKTYKLRPVNPNVRKGRKLRTIPDQSLGLKEIVARFVKGLPVEGSNVKPVYVDQSDTDLEKLSRSDFGIKHEMAQEFGRKSEQIVDYLQEEGAKVTERRTKAEQQKAKSKGDPAPPAIDDLDDTMADDTKQKTK